MRAIATPKSARIQNEMLHLAQAPLSFQSRFVMVKGRADPEMDALWMLLKYLNR